MDITSLSANCSSANSHSSPHSLPQDEDTHQAFIHPTLFLLPHTNAAASRMQTIVSSQTPYRAIYYYTPSCSSSSRIPSTSGDSDTRHPHFDSSSITHTDQILVIEPCALDVNDSFDIHGKTTQLESIYGIYEVIFTGSEVSVLSYSRRITSSELFLAAFFIFYFSSSPHMRSHLHISRSLNTHPFLIYALSLHTHTHTILSTLSYSYTHTLFIY